MSIKVKCVTCGKQLTAPDSAVGRKAKCPSCGRTLTIPPPKLATMTPEDPAGALTTEFTLPKSDGRWKEVGATPQSPLSQPKQDSSSLSDDDVLVDLATYESSEKPLGRDFQPKASKQNTTGNPFATAPVPEVSYDPLGRGRKPSGRRPFVTPLGQRGIGSFLLNHKMALAVAMGTALIALAQLYGIISTGFSPGVLLGLPVIAVGVLISAFGFLPRPHRPRKQSVSMNRAKRVGGWFIAGIIGVILTLIAVKVAAVNGISVPILAAISSPFFIVFPALVLITALILLYYGLVILFPRITGFDIAAGTYLLLFVILPLLLIATVGLITPSFLTAARENQAKQQASKRPPGREVSRQPIGAGRLIPPASTRPGAVQGPHLFRPRSLSLPGFPIRDEAVSLVPGVEVVDVLLKVPAGQPGNHNRLRIYTPSGTHPAKSLPCVLIAPAGTNMLSGSRLDDGADHPERIPYVLAGYVVVAYELDGEYLTEDPSDAEVVRAYREFVNADAGVVNGKNAFEYVLARVPEVDPAKIYAVGHSSAATVALLLAEHEPRIAGCVAFAAVGDLRLHLGDQASLISSELPGGSSFLRDGSPITHIGKLQCPVMLFHARDDSVVPLEESTRMAAAIRNRNGNMNLQTVTVPSGDHYDAMIDQGIPRAIQWLEQLGDQ